jgi:predicted Fe-S protein YdhL (DUF1289 family)
VSQASEDPPDPRREARRARRRAQRRNRAVAFDTSIPSPCIQVCQIDQATDLCFGCLRAIDEIRDWPILTLEQKTAVLARVAERRAQAGAPGGTRGLDL